jgi:hypothetical protein
VRPSLSAAQNRGELRMTERPKKTWKKPVIKVLKAGAAEAQKNTGTPDSKFGKSGMGGQYS